jgi:hypothetical protein
MEVITMKQRLLLVFCLFSVIMLSVASVLAGDCADCWQQCEAEKNKCIEEQLSTTLDPQKQDELIAACQAQYEECKKPCRACEGYQ